MVAGEGDVGVEIGDPGHPLPIAGLDAVVEDRGRGIRTGPGDPDRGCVPIGAVHRRGDGQDRRHRVRDERDRLDREVPGRVERPDGHRVRPVGQTVEGGVQVHAQPGPIPSVQFALVPDDAGHGVAAGPVDPDERITDDGTVPGMADGQRWCDRIDGEADAGVVCVVGPVKGPNVNDMMAVGQTGECLGRRSGKRRPAPSVQTVLGSQ